MAKKAKSTKKRMQIKDLSASKKSSVKGGAMRKSLYTGAKIFNY